MASGAAESGAVRALLRAPAFVHVGLAIGAAAVVLAVVLVPARFALQQLALPGLSLWGVVAAAMAGVLATVVYAGCVYACCRRSDSDGRRVSAAMARRAGRSAVVRFVAMQLVFIAGLLLLACSAIAVFRNSAPGVFLAALATGCAGVLAVALWFLDRSRFAALADLADGFALPAGWRAMGVAHVHQQRVKAALAWDAETARREQRPSLASRLVPAGHAAAGGAARRPRGRVADLASSLASALTGEARLRLRGLLPVVALAVPYGAAAAVAAAMLTPPPPGPLPTLVSDVAAARPGDRLPHDGAFGGSQGAGGQGGAGGEPRSQGSSSNAGAGGQGGAGGEPQSQRGSSSAGPGGQPGAGGSGPRRPGAGGEPRPAAPGTAGGDVPAARRDGTTVNGADGSKRGAADGRDQQASGSGRGVAGGGGEHGAGGGGAAAGSGVLPAADSRGAAQGAGSGRGPRSAPKPFVEGRQADGRPNAGGEIVVSGIETGADAVTGVPSVPDSAVSRGIRLTPAPLIDWSPPSVSHHADADVPRVYRPRQALPAWTAPLVPGAAPARP
jgi:hypothetical protein